VQVVAARYTGAILPRAQEQGLEYIFLHMKPQAARKRHAGLLLEHMVLQ
jgi:hypothetical protein